ncbi:hypothetical protein Tco_0786826 [Tanacetum coccineum]
MNRYGLDGPEDKLEKGLWSEIEQQKIKISTSLLRVDMVLNPPWNLPFLGAKGLTSPEQTATGKGISNPLMALTMDIHLSGGQRTDYSRIDYFNDSPLTGVNTPGSDENRMKLYELMYNIVNFAEESLKTNCYQDLKT